MNQRGDAMAKKLSGSQQGILQTILKDLKSDPSKYAELRDRVKAAKTDKEKAEVLVGFATDYEALKNQMPELRGEIAEAGITTVAITTTIT
jgi:hypothetical protein